jgi:hypothetical protein
MLPLIYKGLHVKNPLFLSDFNKNCTFMTISHSIEWEIFQNRVVEKIEARVLYSIKISPKRRSHPLWDNEAKYGRGQLKCDGTRAETRFRLSAKRTSPFKLAGASVQSTTGSRGVRISGSNAGYTMFRGSAKSSGYPFHSPISPSLPLPCVTVCHHISTAVSSHIGHKWQYNTTHELCMLDN